MYENVSTYIVIKVLHLKKYIIKLLKPAVNTITM